MALLRVMALCALLVTAGCAGFDAKSGGAACGRREEVEDRFWTCLHGGQFHEAFLLMDELAYEYRGTGEDHWADAEYWSLVSTTAANGEREWAGILKDRRIPLQRKLDLMDNIYCEDCRAREEAAPPSGTKDP